MSRTLQSFLQNEIRALEITVRDQDGNSYVPDGAYYSVQDINGDYVTSAGTPIDELPARVLENTVSTIIGEATTAQVGTYYIIWKLLKDNYTYLHVTELEVAKLI